MYSYKKIQGFLWKLCWLKNWRMWGSTPKSTNGGRYILSGKCIKMTSYQHRKSHCGDETNLLPFYLQNGISYTGKMTSLYWIRARVIISKIMMTRLLHYTRLLFEILQAVIVINHSLTKPSKRYILLQRWKTVGVEHDHSDFPCSHDPLWVGLFTYLKLLVDMFRIMPRTYRLLGAKLLLDILLLTLPIGTNLTESRNSNFCRKLQLSVRA